LSRVSGAQSIALAPLSNTETTALVTSLLGPDPSTTGIAALVAERAAGNPFFAEEMVRDLLERGVMRGTGGSYVSTVDVAEVSMPATVQATIAGSAGNYWKRLAFNPFSRTLWWPNSSIR